MKKNLLFTLASTLFLAGNVHAQFVYDHAFSLGLNANDQGSSIASDAAGNTYCTGVHTYWMDINPLGTPYYIYNNGVSSADIYVAKYDQQGILVWGFDVGGSGDDAAFKIRLDANNDVYVVGRFQDTVDFNPGGGNNIHISNGGNDIFLAKYDNSGNFLWANTIGDSLNEQGWDVAVDAVSGNAIVTGGYASFTMDMDPGNLTHLITNNGYAAFNTSNCFVAAYSQATGAYQWSFSIGGYDGATGEAIATDGSGNIYIGGIVSGDSTDFDPGNGDYWVGSNGSGDIFLAKYNTTADFQWAHSNGGTGGETANSLASDNNGNVYQGGFFNSDSVDFDPGAGVHYLHNYPSGVQDIYVVKFNNSGQFNWALSVGGYYSEVAQDIALDDEGHFFITGNFGDTVDFDPGPGTHYVYGNLGSEAYLAEYDTAGHFIDVIPFNGVGHQFGIGVCAIPPNKVGVTGFFSADSIDFDPGPGIHNLINNGGNSTWNDAFVATYSYMPTGINSLSEIQGINIFPNPASNSINISFRTFSTVDEINILNVFGQSVYHSTEKLSVGTWNKQIDCRDILSGIYFIQIETKKEIQTEKFIKQ